MGFQRHHKVATITARDLYFRKSNLSHYSEQLFGQSSEIHDYTDCAFLVKISQSDRDHLRKPRGDIQIVAEPNQKEKFLEFDQQMELEYCHG